jgi:four helix bundle protein
LGRDFKKILAWKLADDLTVQVYQVTSDFPSSEHYGLVNQLRRAAVSVPANIAEGASRRNSKEFLQFLYIAKSSLAEVDYCLHLAFRLGYMTADVYEKIDSAKEEVAKVLRGLMKAIAGVRRKP